ncbi:MAG: 2,5-diamino-6-(ribosylamino)-4(3H)-pyrimidinone 5'-phosphate reductase [Candidatus Bathyarchaeia archaeon]|nr:2,5-diamino-6-(ribosylamino)-4(3H)-pyrimidinone 5'-phosphate reductase [Candidatus Bathyarchaeota archaeon]
MCRPYVIVGGFMTVDGKTAPASRKGRLFTPMMNEDLVKRLHMLRANVDAVLVGVGTVLEDDPKLTVREVQGNNPIRIILDSKATIPLDSEVLNIREAPTIVAVCENAEAERVDRLVGKGVEVIRCKCDGRIDLKFLLEEIYRKGVRRMLVEGGSEVRWSFIKERLVDEVFVWVAPYIWGGRDAPTMVGGDGYQNIDCAFSLKLKNLEVVDNTVILHYVASK